MRRNTLGGSCETLFGCRVGVCVRKVSSATAAAASRRLRFPQIERDPSPPEAPDPLSRAHTATPSYPEQAKVRVRVPDVAQTNHFPPFVTIEVRISIFASTNFARAGSAFLPLVAKPPPVEN